MIFPFFAPERWRPGRGLGLVRPQLHRRVGLAHRLTGRCWWTGVEWNKGDVLDQHHHPYIYNYIYNIDLFTIIAINVMFLIFFDFVHYVYIYNRYIRTEEWYIYIYMWFSCAVYMINSYCYRILKYLFWYLIWFYSRRVFLYIYCFFVASGFLVTLYMMALARVAASTFSFNASLSKVDKVQLGSNCWQNCRATWIVVSAASLSNTNIHL